MLIPALTGGRMPDMSPTMRAQDKERYAKAHIRFVRYRYTGPLEGGQKMHGTWRVYRNKRWIAPIWGLYSYMTKADAMAAVDHLLLGEQLAVAGRAALVARLNPPTAQ
jgi:hypothetical protein